MFHLWLTMRFVFKGRMFNLPTILALIGMVIGVATLVVTISVISGVDSLLKKAVTDVTGHFMVMKPGGEKDPKTSLKPVIAKAPGYVAMTPFVHIEAVMARGGRINGVILQGVDTSTVHDVLNLKNRVIDGEFNLNEVDGIDAAVAGKELVKKFGLKLGDIFSVVMPRPSKSNASSFTPTQIKLRLTGVMDLGKYEFNDRFIIVSDLAAQNLAGIGNVYSGVRVKLTDPDLSKEAGFAVFSELGHPYWVRDWYDANYNFFSAVEIEKRVIFIVLSFMIVVASFNISSTLFVSVLKRFRDLSILQTIGARRSSLVKLFVLQGLMLGVIGSVLGLFLGVTLAKWISSTAMAHVPGEIYKFDHLPVEFRPVDLTAILLVSFVICFFSTLIPAIKGAKLDPIEGLKYE